MEVPQTKPDLARRISARDRERFAALTVGLAATIGAWSFVAAFAPSLLEALSGSSPWFHGPASTSAWALCSGIAYLLLRRRDRTGAASDAMASYRCPELALRAQDAGGSVCANREEKRRLAAVTAGFALTIGVWVAALSFLPGDWFDALEEAPVWFYCLVSVVLWIGFTTAMHLALRPSALKPSQIIRPVRQ